MLPRKLSVTKLERRKMYKRNESKRLLVSTQLRLSRTLSPSYFQDLRKKRERNPLPFFEIKFKFSSWEIQKYWVSLEFRQQITLHLGCCHLSSAARGCIIRSEERVMEGNVRRRWNETKSGMCRECSMSSVKSNRKLFPATNWNDHCSD